VRKSDRAGAGLGRMDLCQNWRDDGVAFDGTAAAAALKAETRRAERITRELECGTAVALL
jgi:hypothetical protein